MKFNTSDLNVPSPGLILDAECVYTCYLEIDEWGRGCFLLDESLSIRNRCYHSNLKFQRNELKLNSEILCRLRIAGFKT